MIPAVLGLIPKGWLVAGVVAAAGLIAFGIQHLRIVNLELALSMKENEVIRLRADVEVVTINRDGLKKVIENQNAAIAGLRHSAEVERLSADKRVADALRAAERRRRAAAEVKGAGPEVMNRWVADTMGAAR